MTPESETPAQAEPTMEEILASIRKIIASDKPEEAAPVAAQEEILELTDVVPEPVAAAPAESPAPEPVVAPPDPPPAKEVAMPAPEAIDTAPSPDALLSDMSAQASASVFATLSQHLQQERQSLATDVSLGNGQQTLEGLVISIIRPMLKEWLDQNLPSTVERMVQREIERIARFHRD